MVIDSTSSTSEDNLNQDAIKRSLVIKEKGNDLFRNGDYEEAICNFSDAIRIYPHDPAYYCNRSMCYASILNWEDSLADAKRALFLDNKYVKAYYRCIKAQIELKLYKEARISFQHVHRLIKTIGKDLELLEKQLVSFTGIPLRPVIDNFKLLDLLGEGNFSKIYKAVYIPSGKEFSIKEIEKATVKRMKRRHPNINNEIMMERQVLYKLQHPNIIPLYCTFQDSSALYYLTEYLGGGELWSAMSVQYTSTVSGDGLLRCMIGLAHTLARFYSAELINVLEYMHSRGIAHRDLKPENIMISIDGHIRVIDFGTAKDLLEPELNGQEFVGTAEYMSPEAVKSRATGIETDLWALGCIIYQFYTGYSAFSSATPYLAFLKIKRGTPRWPSQDLIPVEAMELIGVLLEKNRAMRLENALGSPLPTVTGANELRDTSASASASASTETYRTISGTSWTSLDTENEREREREIRRASVNTAAMIAGGKVSSLRGLPPLDYSRIHYDKLRQLSLFTSESVPFEERNMYSLDRFRHLAEGPATRVPSLSELCLTKVCVACTVVADAVARNGGTRPDIPWIKSFNLQALSSSYRARIAHILSRQQKLHPPGIFRLFHSSVVDARCMRASVSTKEFIGLSRDIHGEWESCFCFAVLSNPVYGMYSASIECEGDITGGMDWSREQERLQKAISAINKLRPKFVVVLGDMTCADPSLPSYIAQSEAVRRTLARISETIPVLLLPGAHDMGKSFNQSSIDAYIKRYGSDYYGFWFGGIRGIVLNSSLLIHPQNDPDHAAAQSAWFDEELEQAKLCAHHVMIFSHHAWCLSHQDEEDSEWVIPKTVRKKWFKLMHNRRVKGLFCGHYYSLPTTMCFPADNPPEDLSVATEIETEKKDDKNDPHVFGEDEEGDIDSNASLSDNELDDSKLNPDDAEHIDQEDKEYEGPELITTSSIGMPLDETSPGIRIVKVYEQKIEHQYYSLENIPKKIEFE